VTGSVGSTSKRKDLRTRDKTNAAAIPEITPLALGPDRRANGEFAPAGGDRQREHAKDADQGQHAPDDRKPDE
jgi:hypothetical protein